MRGPARHLLPSVMTLGRHGAVRSLSSVTVRIPQFRFMRASNARGASGVGILDRYRCCCHRRFISPSRSRPVLYRNYSRMRNGKAAHQVWHVSRGIVFAGGADVVYPRLPRVSHYSTPAAAPPEGNASSLPPVSLTRNAPEDAPAGQGADTAAVTTVVATNRTAVSTTMSTSITTITTATTTTSVVAGDNAAKESQAPAQDAAEPEPKDAAPRVPPFTPLDFKIPDKAFQDAARASEGTPQSFWNYTLYRGPANDGGPGPKVIVHYCTSSRTTERVIQQYFLKEKVLGLDLEWMPNALKVFGPRSNVSLVQLASPSRIGLFHIAAYPKNDSLVAPSLKKLLEDPGITKVGVWIKGDCTRLSDFLDIKTRGQFELSHLYKLVKYSRTGEYNLINKKLAGMASQVKDVLGLPMFKGNDVRASDWSKALNMDQIVYSSSDAYAAMQLYAVLDHQRKALDPVPPLPHHAELNLPIPVTKPAPPTAAEEQDVDPDAVVEEGTATDGKPIPADETVLKDTLVREDGPAPEEQPATDNTAALGDGVSPNTETDLNNQTTPIVSPQRDANPRAKGGLPQPSLSEPSPAAETQPQAETTPQPNSRSLAKRKEPGPVLLRKPRGRPPAKAKESMLPAKLIPAPSLSLFPIPNQTSQPPTK